MSNLVGFDCNEGTLVVWFIIGGSMSSNFLLAYIFMATEGKIVMVVLSTILCWNLFGKSWSATVFFMF